MVRLEKEKSRQRWSELRDLWNEYDPIGVMADPEWPRDEYDAYLGPTLRLLERRASLEEIVGYLEDLANYMGLDIDRSEAQLHAAKFIRWYQDKWPGTTV